MPKELKINKSGVKFDDINYEDADILDPEVDKADIKKQEKLQKDAERESKKMEREFERESKKMKKETDKLEQDAGIFGGKSANQCRAQLVRYRNHVRMGKYLKEQQFKLDDTRINKLDENQLNELLELVKFSICHRNQSNVVHQMGKGAVSLIEIAGCKAQLQIQGLTQELCVNEPNKTQFDDLVDEILIEKQLLVYTKPEIRLLMLVAQTAGTLHVKNKMMGTVMNNNENKDDVSKIENNIKNDKPDLKDKYFDL